jgi:hypothetical protein
LKELFKDRDDLRGQLFVRDQTAAVGLSVDPDLVDLDPAQLAGVEWAAWRPAWAEVGALTGRIVAGAAVCAAEGDGVVMDGGDVAAGGGGGELYCTERHQLPPA